MLLLRRIGVLRNLPEKPGGPSRRPVFRRYAERCAEKNMGVMLRFGSKRAVIVFPPALAIAPQSTFLCGSARLFERTARAA